MNNSLTTSQGSAIADFNPTQASLLEMRADAERFPRLKSLPREQAVLGMARIVSQAFLYRGQPADPQNIQFIASSLVTELMEDERYGARYITLAEIQVVVKRAVLGGSEMFGVSVASLYKVIMDFVKGEGHANQKAVQERTAKLRSQAFDNSGVSVMAQAFAGEFVTKDKKDQ